MKKKVSFDVDETLILKEAIENRNLKKITRLILSADKNSFDINRRFELGQTLLHLAIINGVEPFLIRRLIMLGADPNIENDELLTPLYFAFLNSRLEEADEFNYETILLLIEYGADINHENINFINNYQNLIKALYNNLGFSSLEELISYLDHVQIQGYNVQLLPMENDILSVIDQGIFSTLVNQVNNSIQVSVIKFVQNYPEMCRLHFNINNVEDFLSKLERGEVSDELLNLIANLLPANINVYYLDSCILRTFEPTTQSIERINIDLLYNLNLNRYHFIYSLNQNYLSNSEISESLLDDNEWNNSTMTINSNEYYQERLGYSGLISPDDENNVDALPFVASLGCNNIHQA